MADAPFAPARSSAAPLVLAAFDVEGKIPRALEALGPVEGREAVLLDADGDYRARQILSLGARLTVVTRRPRAVQNHLLDADGPILVRRGTPERTGLPGASADVMVSFWSVFRGPGLAALVEAERVLRPGGRLLVVHDYGHDDMSPLRRNDDEVTSWGRRDGWFLRSGFRIRVLHCWWTFESLGDAERVLLELAEPSVVGSVLGRMRRPRLSHRVAVYHRSRAGDPGGEPGQSDQAGQHGVTR